MKFYQLIWSAVIILFFSSCNKNWFSQDPLSGVPDLLKEGVLETGSKQFAQFDDFIVEKMLRITVDDKIENILEFQEGEEAYYKIKLELLSGFASKYEIVDLKNPFSSLTGSEWTYDSKTKTGVLKWTPDRTINKGAIYTKLDFQIPVELKETGYTQKNSNLTVLKDIKLFIYKTTYQPEIVGFRTKYNSYIKLEDNLFYEDTEVQSLNLNHYNKVFMEFSDSDDLLEINPNHILRKEIFKVIDKKKSEVPYDILSYMKRPYYELVEVSKKEDCVAFKDQNLCWLPLKDVENLTVEKQVYVKNYIIPKNLDIEKLYYKADSTRECQVYDNKYWSKGQVFIESFRESQREFCYLPLRALDFFRDHFVSEIHSIYLFKEKEDIFQKLEITKWEEFFEEIPLYLKFQMNGYEGIENINIDYINDRNYNELVFKIKNENHYNFQSDIHFENIRGQKAYSLLPIYFKLQSFTGVDDDSIFEVEFSFDIEKHEEYETYHFQVFPSAGPIRGESIPIKVSVFPSILREIEYQFDPESDLEVREVWESTTEGEERVGLTIDLKTQIRNRYTFPKKVYENLNFLDSFKEKVIFEELKAKSNFCNLGSDPFAFLKGEGKCSCSEKNFYKDKEENIYIESICTYSAKFLFPEHLEDHSSGYMQYDYRITGGEKLSLSDFSQDRVFSINEKSYLINETAPVKENKSKEPAKNEPEKNQSVEQPSMNDPGEIPREEIEEIPRKEIEEIPRKEIEEIPRKEIEVANFETFIHLFFHLKAEWKCEQSSESNKERCMIHYLLPDSKYIEVDQGAKSFLAEHILVETKCFRRDDKENFALEYPCECSAIELFVNRLDFMCEFDSDTLMEFRLKTDHPQIYFFNKGEEGDKQTPLKRGRFGIN